MVFIYLSKNFHINNILVPLPNVIQMLSQTPAEIAKLSHIGSIKIGNRADLLLFNEKYQLEKTIVSGNIVFENYDYI